MFLNPIWSALLLCAAVALYIFLIRPYLKTEFAETYADLNSFWSRVWAFLTHFKKTLIAILAILLAAAPDLLVLIAPVDFSAVLPQPWAAFVGPICMGIIALMRAAEARKSA